MANETNEKSEPQVRSTELLAALSDLRDRACELKEECRGPGKHFAFMAMMDACIGLNRAVGVLAGLQAANAERSNPAPKI